MPAGRPSSYRPEYATVVEKLCLLGARDADLARVFDVSESTIDNWKAAHPEFLAALKAGRELADAEVANSLYRRAIGDGDRPPDVTACIFWLKNRRPDLWRDAHRQEHAITTPEKADMSPEERARRAAEMVDRAFGRIPNS